MDIRDELAMFNREFSKALVEHDLDRIASFYTPDAVFLSQGFPTFSGRSRIIDDARRTRYEWRADHLRDW